MGTLNMKLEKQAIKRLAIYFFYDPDGVVDNYVIYLLNDLLKNISELLIVCNGKLTSKGREKFEELTPNILVRENKGFDVWAYKEGMEYYGWEKLKTLDELILLNSTIMGPLFPFNNMFSEMNARDVDFWGITCHSKVDFDPFKKSKYGYLPVHIQSHFLAIRKHMLQSIEYKKYWDARPLITNYEEAICWHEIIFTKEFEDKGFIWQTYVDTSDLAKYVANPIMLDPFELINNRKCPIFKRRSFFHDYHEFLSLSNGNASLDLFEYIKNHTNYDINMIWDNILRTQNQADIKNCLHLNYIIPSNVLENQEAHHHNHRIALVMHIYFVDLIKYCYRYAQSMPEESDIYITTNTEEKKVEILKQFQDFLCKKLEVNVIKNRGRDVSALLVSTKEFIMKYDYVCFVHDKKVGQLDWGIKGKAFSDQCFENLLKSSYFVENVIEEFEKNPRLGLLSPPPPGFASYYFTFGLPWSNNFDLTKKLASELKLNVSIRPDKDPIAPLGTMFWFRPQALKILFDKDWNYSDFPEEPNASDGTLLHAIERVYPFVAQQAGYYSAWVLADTFAKLDLTNQNFLLSEINKKAFQIYGIHSHYDLINSMQAQIINSPANPDLNQALKIIIKEKIKRIIPQKYWNVSREIYYLLRPKKYSG
jgi:lipopolysaccharide biosynthesis protein